MFEEIKSHIAELLDVKEDTITLESELVADLKADSMDIATLMFDVEEKYGIVIDEDDLDSLKTVGDIVKYIEDRK